jgi:UDP-N-acetylmuramoyl-tripeptide--D-alanyl-D-alanine ligase
MAIGLGLPADRVAALLSSAEPASRWRMELRERADGLLVVNDAYNANPDSMRAALDTLAAIDRGPAGRRFAVLGEMKELGEECDSSHRAVGAYAAESGVDVLVTVGPVAALMAEGAGGVAGWQGESVVTAGRDEALARVRENVAAADVVLVKASRGAALEHVADGLLADDVLADGPSDDEPHERGSTP